MFRRLVYRTAVYRTVFHRTVFHRTAPRRTVPRRTVAVSALALAPLGVLAAASPAQAANAVGPKQYFAGQVTGATGPSVIEVACPGTGTSAGGHPVAGQTVQVNQLFPPVSSTTAGYTGNSAVEIDASLIFPAGPVNSRIPVATFTQYSLPLPIPTSITVPCTGSAVMDFSPYPDDSGTPSDVTVTFLPQGITQAPAR